MKLLIRFLDNLAHLFPFNLIIVFTEKIKCKSYVTYSNYGEDAILQGILKRLEIDVTKENWSFIDLGAWKPISHSNTYFLYKIGLRGTVVEPNLDLRLLWKACRPKDDFLNVACSIKNEKAIFYRFGVAGQSSTLDVNFAKTIERLYPEIVKQQIEVNSWTLEEIIKYHRKLHKGNFILDVDVEGLDFEIIKSYDFSKFERPSIILIETFEDIGNLDLGEIETFMSTKGYFKIGSSIITSFYADLWDNSLRKKINNALLH